MGGGEFTLMVSLLKPNISGDLNTIWFSFHNKTQNRWVFLLKYKLIFCHFNTEYIAHNAFQTTLIILWQGIFEDTLSMPHIAIEYGISFSKF